MALETLHDLLIHELKDLYSAEKQLTKAIPKLAKKASNPQLREALNAHLHETENQVVRLEQIFERLSARPGGMKCKGMAGLIEEGSDILQEGGSAEVIDAGIICAAQRVEHYEIAAYGCARTFAEVLGEPQIARMLSLTLDEESAANEKLNQIALDSVNQEAAGVEQAST
jgi:ferritin-like metal-binding protein YciE